jgi:peptidoglycan-associated lipoprotein
MAAATSAPVSSTVQIEDRIVAACGNIPMAHFDFDSSRVRPDATVGLNALATCFESGPLKGHSMHLIGHTDPRGETEYNLGLGQRRAGSVLGYLADHGLPKEKAAAYSRGELDATGTDDSGWARDRRVDVVLAN